MAQACREAGISRILIVGGAPASHKELNRNIPSGLELRLVEGDVNRDRQRAAADLKWCHVVVIWAGTILGHDVSNQYVNARVSNLSPVVWVRRRSIEALCDAVVQHIRQKGDRNKSG